MKILAFLIYVTTAIAWEIMNEETKMKENQKEVAIFEEQKPFHYPIGENHYRMIKFTEMDPLAIREVNSLPSFASIKKLSFVFNYSSLNDISISAVQDFVSLDNGEIFILRGNMKVERYIYSYGELLFIQKYESLTSQVDSGAKLYLCRDRRQESLTNLFIIGNSVVDHIDLSVRGKRSSFNINFASNSRKIMCNNKNLFFLHDNGVFDVLEYNNNGEYTHIVGKNMTSYGEKAIDFDLDHESYNLVFLFESLGNFVRSYVLDTKMRDIMMSGVVIEESFARKIFADNGYLYIVKDKESHHSIKEFIVDYHYHNFTENREYILHYNPSHIKFNPDILIAYSYGQIYVAKRKISSKVIDNDGIGNSEISSDIFGFKWQNIGLNFKNRSSFLLVSHSDTGVLDFFTFFYEEPFIEVKGVDVEGEIGNYKSEIQVSSIDCSWRPYGYRNWPQPTQGCIYKMNIELEYYTDQPRKERLSWIYGFLLGVIVLALVWLCMLTMVHQKLSYQEHERIIALKTLSKRYEVMDESKVDVQNSTIFTEYNDIKTLN